MKRVQAGDYGAFEELVSLWRAPAEHFAESIVRDYALSEDIAQDCFVKLWVFRDKYCFEFSFKTYLFTLIKHRAIDELRKNRRLTELPAEFSELISDENTPEEIYLRSETEQRIFEEIERLRQTDGDCFYLFAVCGIPAREIAKRLEITEVNVRVKIHRTRAKLKKILEKEGLI